MSDILLFIITELIAIRTFLYGIWVFLKKNIIGGIFVIILALSIVFLSLYILFFNRT